jgi:UDP-N-acetylglucosamine--N-acetylmuramyl-(pentapeptide) pyrophosphoryl-undecaprenol N-acetylglucosamine transferase
MRLLLAGGGTGGHIYPALALAESLQSDEVLFVGEREGLAEQLVTRAGFPFQPIAHRRPGRNPFILASDFLRALRSLRQWKPDVVIGTGGYVSACAVWSASWLRVPVLILDFNALPGRTNRRLAQRANKIGVSFEEAIEYFPRKKTVLTGTPVRRAVLTAQRTPARARWGIPLDAQLLVIFGGSQAAQSINDATFVALPQWLAQHDHLHVIHLCGERDLEHAPHPTPHAPRYHPMAFCHDMGDVLAAADLVLCRAGGVSIAEITARGLPAILVPYPHAMDNHQEYNARALERHGAAVVVLDRDLNRVADAVSVLLADESRRNQLTEASRAQGKPAATERVLELARTLLTAQNSHR